MRRVRSRDTGPEERLRAVLRRLKLRFRVCDARLPGKPDIVFARARLAVFIDGDYWHGNQWRRRGLACLEEQFANTAATARAYWLRKIRRNMDRDCRVTAALIEKGWRVLRLWESQIAADVEKCAALIAREAFDSGKARGKRSCATAAAAAAAVAEAAASATASNEALAVLARREAEIWIGGASPSGAPCGNASASRALGSGGFSNDAIREGLKAEGWNVICFHAPDSRASAASLARVGRGIDLANAVAALIAGISNRADSALRAIGARKPPLIALELPAGLLRRDKESELRKIILRLHRLSYWLDAFVWPARRVGNRRTSLFIVGLRERDIEGLTLEQARQSHSPMRPPRLIRAMASASAARWRLAPLPLSINQKDSNLEPTSWIARYILNPTVNSLLRADI